MSKGTITTSYGRAATVNGMATPYLYGSGYGKDDELAAFADRAAEFLASRYGLDVEKRGNSDGLSAGAFYDLPPGGLASPCLGLGADRGGKGLTYHAMFFAVPEDAEAIAANVPGRTSDLDAQERALDAMYGQVERFGRVYSPAFSTFEEAQLWLAVWGERYCPVLKAVQK